MSDGSPFRFTPKRRKVQCSKCDEIYDNDYASRHMTRRHPALVSAGNKPPVTLLKDSSQPSVSTFFQKSQPQPSSCNQPLTSSNETNNCDAISQNELSNVSDHDEHEIDETTSCELPTNSDSVCSIKS